MTTCYDFNVVDRRGPGGSVSIGEQHNFNSPRWGHRISGEPGGSRSSQYRVAQLRGKVNSRRGWAMHDQTKRLRPARLALSLHEANP